MGSRPLSRTLGWTSGFRCRDEVYFSSTMPLKEKRKNTVTFSLFFNEIASDWTVASIYLARYIKCAPGEGGGQEQKGTVGRRS